jgi:hypothetical protein
MGGCIFSHMLYEIGPQPIDHGLSQSAVLSLRSAIYLIGQGKIY